MTDLSNLRSRVAALLRETEAGPHLNETAIVKEIDSRYGPTPPDPIPDFWAIADRYGS